jgi:hypothetical protein
MGKRSDIDKAIRNIMKWLDRPEWAERRAAVFEAHLAPVGKHLGMDLEELAMEASANGYGGMLLGVQFEDLLSRDTDGENSVDDYLKRRGWRESVRGRRYLNALRNSTLSLYEIIDVDPGHHCDLRDLVRGGKPMRVSEKAGTQQMVKWDRIAARVLSGDGKHIFSGGILPFAGEAAQSLLRLLNASREALHENLDDLLAGVSAENATEMAQSLADIDNQYLREACPAFTNIWLAHTLKRLHAPLPELYNSDGDAISFIETHFPLAGETGETRAAIIQRLNAAPGWVVAGDEPPCWNWLEADPPVKKQQTSQEGTSIDTLLDGRHPVSDNLELTDRALIFSTNSEARTERGKAALGALLEGLVGTPLAQIQTPEQMLAEADDRDGEDGLGDETATQDIDPEIAAAMMNDYFDQHYRRCLDEPIPALDDKTPRQCAASEADRPMVIDWLKQLENGELHRAAQSGQKPYDTVWLWEELGLEP